MQFGTRMKRIKRVGPERYRVAVQYTDGFSGTVDLRFILDRPAKRPLVGTRSSPGSPREARAPGALHDMASCGQMGTVGEGRRMARSMAKVRILMVGLVLAGCAAGLVPVRDATQRFELRGVSVLPPRGDGWYVVERDDRHVMLTKGLQGPHTLSAFVVTFLVTGAGVEDPQLLPGLVDQALKSEGRFRRVESSMGEDRSPGAECVRYHGVIEERDNPKLPGLTLRLIRRGLVCRHPIVRGLVVGIEHSERHAQGTPPGPAAMIEAELGPFLQSLVFTPAR